MVGKEKMVPLPSDTTPPFSFLLTVLLAGYPYRCRIVVEKGRGGNWVWAEVYRIGISQLQQNRSSGVSVIAVPYTEMAGGTGSTMNRWRESRWPTQHNLCHDLEMQWLALSCRVV